MKKLIFILPSLCLILSCATMPTMPVMATGNNKTVDQDQVHAENRIMKKNLDLALRENEVFKSENAQYKSEVKNLKKDIAAVTDELAELTEKYNEDTTRLNEELARLNESYEIMMNALTLMEQESSQKIADLTDQNTGLQKRLTDETARLNTVITDQKASFETQLKTAEKTLAATKAGCIDRETALQGQLTASKQAMTEKDAVIKTLEQTRQETMKKATALEKTIQEQTEKIQDLKKINQELTSARESLQKALAEKQAMINTLSRKPEPAATNQPVQTH